MKTAPLKQCCIYAVSAVSKLRQKQSSVCLSQKMLSTSNKRLGMTLAFPFVDRYCDMYLATVLSDSDDLRSICLRTGDTLHLIYRSKADCPEVQSVVKWLRSPLDLFQVHVPSLLDPVPSDRENAPNTAIQQGKN